MKNAVMMLIVALLAADAGAFGIVGGRGHGYRSNAPAKRLGENCAPSAKAVAEKKVQAKAKSISATKVVIPEDAIYLGSKIDASGRIESLCGFEIGQIAKLPRHPVLDNEGNIVMTGKLKKPFRKCTQYEVKYSKVNHALYYVRVFSPAQRKMDKEAAEAEVSAIAAAVKTKFDDKGFSWSATPGFCMAYMKPFAHQSLQVKSYLDDLESRNLLKGPADARKEKGWAFSLELSDRAMYQYVPPEPSKDGVPAGVDAL